VAEDAGGGLDAHPEIAIKAAIMATTERLTLMNSSRLSWLG
jgi:hypothetical protein